MISVAVLSETQHRTIAQIDSLSVSDCFDAGLIDSRQTSNLLLTSHGRNLKLIGPPLQITLCRWVT
jgi:hypothetical protein